MKLRWKLILIVAAIAAGAYLYLHIRKSEDFEPRIKAKLANLVSKASDGLYQLDMEHIEIDITTESVIAKNILLKPDSIRMLQLEKAKLLPDNIYTISLIQLNLDGLSPLTLLNTKNIEIKQLILDSPEVKVVHRKRIFNTTDTTDLFETIPTDGQSFSIGNLLLRNIHLTITDVDRNKQVSSFNNLSASFTDIRIDSSTKNDTSRFLFAKDAVVFIKGFQYISTKNKYKFSIDSMALRPQGGKLELFSLNLQPIGSKDQFSKKLQYMEDRFDIQLKQVVFKNINWYGLLNNEGLDVAEMTISGGTVNIYNDRRLPLGPAKSGNFPQQLLLKLKLPVTIPTILLQQVDVVYEEFNPESGQTGIVSFFDIKSEINNVTNIPAGIAANGMLRIKATANFMNTGKLTARFNFNLRKAKTGAFNVTATLGQADGAKLNGITRGLALLTIKKLSIDKFETQIDGSNSGANGKLTFAYHDLSFDVLKRTDKGNLKKRGVFSFIANKFVAQHSNPSSKAGTAKVYAVYHRRDPQRTFFNLIWKTMLDGILKTVKGKN